MYIFIYACTVPYNILKQCPLYVEISLYTYIKIHLRPKFSCRSVSDGSVQGLRLEALKLLIHK